MQQHFEQEKRDISKILNWSGDIQQAHTEIYSISFRAAAAQKEGFLMISLEDAKYTKRGVFNRS